MGRKGKGEMEGGKEGRAVRLIDHFLSEWSGLESRRGDEFNLKMGISMGKGFAEGRRESWSAGE